ncbi:MAG: small multi-drug export protein [Clostridia bacterium]|nr:small multi-drug export protein [Clostridia bacterium]
MSELLKHLYVFALSMVPVIELRGAIPLGAGLGLPIYTNYLVSVVGNFLPVPFILLFIRHILAWMKTTKRFAKIALWLEEKAEKHSDKVLRYATFGLFLFVAIPLPGTGAWTGALVAALFRMRMKYAVPSILLGVMAAGVIMALASYGVVGLFQFFL